jgi:predicted ester cyclase
MMLESVYRRYLDALNTRAFDELGEFVHDQLTYNDETWALDQYRDLLVDDVARIPDLHYAIERLVVDGDQVACRIRFDCHPTGVFHGLDAGGRRVTFVEHVFYRFVDGRIAQVWSLLDLDAVRRQLADPT